MKLRFVLLVTSLPSLSAQTVLPTFQTSPDARKCVLSQRSPPMENPMETYLYPSY